MVHMDPESGEPDLPEGVTEEKLTALGEKLVKAVEPLGLYGAEIAFSRAGDHLLISGSFAVGKVAFLPRTQDVETDKFDDEFRKIEANNVYDEKEAIRQRYLDRKPDDGDVDQSGT